MSTNPTEGDEVDADSELELSAVDAGDDAVAVLEARLARSRSAALEALAELRAVATDDEALHEYGIDARHIARRLDRS